jgi:hypothetical protein
MRNNLEIISTRK